MIQQTTAEQQEERLAQHPSQTCLRIRLSYVESQRLQCAGDSIGDGTLWPAQTEIGDLFGKWELKLRCCENPDLTPPFEWELRPVRLQCPPEAPPSRTLDGLLLCALLRERLSPAPLASPSTIAETCIREGRVVMIIGSKE